MAALLLSIFAGRSARRLLFCGRSSSSLVRGRRRLAFCERAEVRRKSAFDKCALRRCAPRWKCVSSGAPTRLVDIVRFWRNPQQERIRWRNRTRKQGARPLCLAFFLCFHMSLSLSVTADCCTVFSAMGRHKLSSAQLSSLVNLSTCPLVPTCPRSSACPRTKVRPDSFVCRSITHIFSFSVAGAMSCGEREGCSRGAQGDAAGGRPTCSVSTPHTPPFFRPCSAKQFRGAGAVETRTLRRMARDGMGCARMCAHAHP